MGFHPGFTGRQNVMMAGQLRGLTAAEVNELMPAIEAFAEIGDYDQPFRVYSSGMQMRLAFSVATARGPDVLIVDEALSVGDSYFQHKSFCAHPGVPRTGDDLVVSHDRYAIQTLCDRALLLHGGRQVHFGPPQEVLDIYHAMLGEIDFARIRRKSLRAGICGLFRALATLRSSTSACSTSVVSRLKRSMPAHAPSSWLG